MNKFYFRRFMTTNAVPHLSSTDLRCKIRSIKDLELEGVTGEQRVIKGWIKSVREQKTATFYALNDGGSLDLQIVAKKEQKNSIKVGSAVQAAGILQKSMGKNQNYDFLLENWDFVDNPAFDEGQSPYSKNFQRQLNLSRHRLNWRPKVETFSAFTRLRSAAKQIMHDFFKARDFIQIDTPILTAADCEGSGESFYVTPSNKSFYANEAEEEHDSDPVEDVENSDEIYRREFFGKPTFLTVSSQMHLEVYANSLQKVYGFNPAFRAESSLTRQHLAEFYMLEAELAFIEDLNQLMHLVERLIVYTTQHLLAGHSKDMQHCLKAEEENRMPELERLLKIGAFPVLSYADATKIIQRAFDDGRVTQNIRHGDDLCKEHERYIVKHLDGRPVFVTHYPAKLKPFYMKHVDSSGEKVAECFDLLAPHCGEVCGGSLRENSYEELKSRMQQRNFYDNFRWYADLRRSGHAPSGGFGLGFERYLQFIFGFRNVKDCLPFPRWYKHCQL